MACVEEELLVIQSLLALPAVLDDVLAGLDALCESARDTLVGNALVFLEDRLDQVLDDVVPEEAEPAQLLQAGDNLTDLGEVEHAGHEAVGLAISRHVEGLAKQEIAGSVDCDEKEQILHVGRCLGCGVFAQAVHEHVNVQLDHGCQALHGAVRKSAEQDAAVSLMLVAIGGENGLFVARHRLIKSRVLVECVAKTCGRVDVTLSLRIGVTDVVRPKTHHWSVLPV